MRTVRTRVTREPVRIYRYIPMVLMLGLALYIYTASLTFGQQIPNPITIETRYVCVLEGDSLWSISARYPLQGKSTLESMEWIERANGISGSILRPGQKLVVPA